MRQFFSMDMNNPRLSTGKGNEILPTLHGGQWGRAAVGRSGAAARCQCDDSAPPLRLVADGESRQPHEFACQCANHADKLVDAAYVARAHVGYHAPVVLKLCHDVVAHFQQVIVIRLHLCSHLICFSTAKVDLLSAK